MAAALLDRGLDRSLWDPSGKDAWLPELLVQLLHPEPFFRGNPADLLGNLVVDS
jgi:hypothetical protein